MNHKLNKLITLFILTSFLLIGCGDRTKNSVDSTNEISIVTSFYPIYIATLNIVKDVPNVKLTNMTKAQTGCLHDYQLSPQDLKTLEKADFFVVNGAGMEAFLDKVISQQKNLKIVDASDNITLISDSDHDEDHTEDAEDYHDHDHDHETNPHVWVSITNAIEQVKNIASQLSTLDPANSTQYASNANKYINKLEALKTEMHSVIDVLPNRDILTLHEAFPYFAQEFDLNIAGVVEIEPGTEPTAKQLEDIIALIKSTGIKAIFAEPQYTSKSIEAIARETNSKIYTLDPIVTGDANEDSYDDYINKMIENMKVLEEALK